MTATEFEGRSRRRIRVVTLAFLIVVQIAMLVALNVFDYSIIFPSFYVHYHGMTIRYAPRADDRNYPEEDDRVIAVE